MRIARQFYQRYAEIDTDLYMEFSEVRPKIMAEIINKLEFLKFSFFDITNKRDILEFKIKVCERNESGELSDEIKVGFDAFNARVIIHVSSVAPEIADNLYEDVFDAVKKALGE